MEKVLVAKIAEKKLSNIVSCCKQAIKAFNLRDKYQCHENLTKMLDTTRGVKNIDQIRLILE